jgi:HlyD family secretion protein
VTWRPLRPAYTRLVLVAALLAAAGGLAVFVLRPAAVSVTDVTRRDIAPAVQGVGTVEAKVVVQISSKITGRIVAVLVDQGDLVEIGQVLVRIDDAQLRAEAQLNDLLAGFRGPEIELQERVRSANATRVLAERELERVEQLHAKELIAAQERDRARHAYDVAVAQERAAQQTLQLAIEGARKHQIEAARNQVDATQRRLELLLAGAPGAGGRSAGAGAGGAGGPHAGA